MSPKHPRRHYDAAMVALMTDAELAQELRNWSQSRQLASIRRAKTGDESLDTTLLDEAAARLDGEGT